LSTATANMYISTDARAEGGIRLAHIHLWRDLKLPRSSHARRRPIPELRSGQGHPSVCSDLHSHERGAIGAHSHGQEKLSTALFRATYFSICTLSYNREPAKEDTINDNILMKPRGKTRDAQRKILLLHGVFSVTHGIAKKKIETINMKRCLLCSFLNKRPSRCPSRKI
jgi:hypothetical protein